ncbi:MAG: T9SS type A sorting domain-containing protein [Bacteroidota bacterium]
MKQLLLFAIAIFSLQSTQAQTLSLDPTFGSNGSVEFPAIPFWWSSYAYFQSIIPTSDNKIWVVSANTNDSKILTCLNTNGNIDSTFGNNGQLALGTDYDIDKFEGVANCQNGKTLVLGSSIFGTGECIDPIVQHQVIFRISASGDLDSTFGINGKMDWVRINKLLYFSKINELETGGFIVARYNNQDDPFYDIIEFDDKGAALPDIVQLKINPEWNLKKILSVTKDDSQKYLVVLSNFFGTYLSRFLKDGTLDLSYGNQGLKRFSNEDYYNEVQVFTKSKLILSGDFEPNGRLSLIQVNVETGLPDETFGNNGLYVFQFNNACATNHRSVKYSENTGWVGVQWVDGQTEIIQLNPDFTPNLNLGPDGHSILPMQCIGFSSAIALNSDKQILFGGTIAIGSVFSHKLVRLEGLNTTSIGSEPTSKSDDYLITPNPAGDYITIDCATKVESLAIYTSNGSCVLFQTSPDKQIDMQNLKAGLYFIKLYGKDGKLLSSKRFVKR